MPSQVWTKKSLKMERYFMNLILFDVIYFRNLININNTNKYISVKTPEDFWVAILYVFFLFFVKILKVIINYTVNR